MAAKNTSGKPGWGKVKSHISEFDHAGLVELIHDLYDASIRQENTRLIRLLKAHGIDWRLGVPEPSDSPSADAAPAETSLSVSEKIVLFRRLFRGRIDVYPTRWETRLESPDTRQPAPTNGDRVCARNLASSAPIAAIARYFPAGLSGNGLPHLPMQNEPKIRFRTSSLVVAPVISSSERKAE